MFLTKAVTPKPQTISIVATGSTPANVLALTLSALSITEFQGDYNYIRVANLDLAATIYVTIYDGGQTAPSSSDLTSTAGWIVTIPAGAQWECNIRSGCSIYAVNSSASSTSACVLVGVSNELG